MFVISKLIAVLPEQTFNLKWKKQ